MDHSRAFGHSADGNQVIADCVLKGDGFGTDVGRHDRPGCIRASTVAEPSEQLRHALDDSIDRQHTTDYAGGSDEDLVRGYSDVSCKQPCGFLCGSQSLGAGTGVRVTAIDENGPSNSLTKM